MPSFGPTELILILAIVVIVFGVGKLPEVGGAVGKSIREFRKASTEEADGRPAPPPSSPTSSTNSSVANSAPVNSAPVNPAPSVPEPTPAEKDRAV